MGKILIKNATLVNEGLIKKAHLEIKDENISAIYEIDKLPSVKYLKEINAEGKMLIPGLIDSHVHFREPGLTHKADIYTESRAAIAGGVTSFMDMPNTIPQTTTQKLLEEKFAIASEKSLANYSFYLGATNSNLNEIEKIDPATVCGLKLFLGSSTGNMLLDNEESLKQVFRNSPVLIAIHSEDDSIIRTNINKYKNKYGDNILVKYHPLIRSEEACYKSSAKAVNLAEKYNSRLHILHISTARELELFKNNIPLKNKKITSEACVHYLWFSDKDYEKYGPRIKWNPAIKTQNDKSEILKGVINNIIDTISTDHAPHTYEEKQITNYPENFNYFSSPSGGPLIQHSLNIMIELYKQKLISLEKIVEKMCHAPADLFRIVKRGYLREGYFADLVLLDINKNYIVKNDNLLYKCKWSPFEGIEFSSKVTHTFVNGELVYENGDFLSEKRGKQLKFDN